MAPGVLGVQHQVILRRPPEFRVLFAGFPVEAFTQVILVLCFFIMFHGIRGTSHTVCPPVGQISMVNRGICKLVFYSCIQLLQGNHANLCFRSIFFIVSLNIFQNITSRRRVVTEYTRYGCDDEIIFISLLLTLIQVIDKVRVQLLNGLSQIPGFSGVHLLHIGIVCFRFQTEHVSKVVVLAVPYQQALALCVFPEIRGLILVQRVHSVVAVDVGEQEFHAVIQQRIAVSHGDAVDVGNHRCFHRNVMCVKICFPLCQTIGGHFIIQQIGEVQISCRKADSSCCCQLAELFFLLFGRFLPELLHTEQCLTVPAELLILRHFHHF